MTHVCRDDADGENGKAQSPADGARSHDGCTCEPAADVVFSAVADRRRRVVLEVVGRRDGAAAVDDVATAVVAVEEDRPPRTVGETERSRVVTSLVHVHLPKLANAGLVAYGEDESGERVVFRGGDEDARSRLLEASAELERLAGDAE